MAAEVFVLGPQRIASPQRGQEDQHNSDIFREVRDDPIITKESCYTQQDVPIVKIRRFLTGDTTNEHELPGPRVVNIWGHVNKALAHPPEPDGRAERLSSHEKSYETNSRDDDLEETSPQDMQKTANR